MDDGDDMDVSLDGSMTKRAVRELPRACSYSLWTPVLTITVRLM